MSDRTVTRAFEDAGAVSPATARPLAEIPGVAADAVIELAARGVIRVAEPGRYFLYAGTEHARRSRLLLIVIAVVLIALPIAMALTAGHWR